MRADACPSPISKPFAEPAALGPRRLWRAVIRPLVEEASGDIVCDVNDGAIAEGLLVTTQATLHAVGTSDALEELAQIYGDRVVFHTGAASAWGAVPLCRLAVLDVEREFSGHLEALTALAESDGPLPPVLIQGLAADRVATDPAIAAFTAGGWAVIELPGFDQIRLVLPGGRGVLDGPTLRGDPRTIALRRARSRSADAPARRRPSARSSTAACASSSEGSRRPTPVASWPSDGELATERHRRGAAALQRRGARGSRPRTPPDRGHARHADSAYAEAAAAHARVARLAHTQLAVRADLVRLEASQSWRIGHWLTRPARILTFRKPGRTNGLSKAIERIDAVTPPGDDHR